MSPLKLRWSIICLAGAASIVLTACGREVRDDTLSPRTVPAGEDDPRIVYFDRNAYQIAQGGRYATWYGCLSCHGQGAQDGLNLGDAEWRHGGSFNEVYRTIAEGHPQPLPRYGERIPVQQLWQITAYVRNLESFGAERIRRQSFDQAAEAQGSQWSGPLR